MSPRGLAVLALSFLGMIDTLYLSLSRGGPPVPCHITTGCGDVLNSAYSEVAGIPLSWFGLGFYVTVFGVTAFAVSGGTAALGWLRWPTLLALGVSIVLTGIQMFVLEAFCEYCLTSAGLSTGIFALVWTDRSRRGA
jgi:uncharacterized membrane protein